MPEFRVEVTRTVELTVEATSEQHATDKAFVIAWNWQPEEATGGDQGQVSVRVITDG